MEEDKIFSESQSLMLQQLRILEWLNSKTQAADQKTSEKESAVPCSIPLKWELTKNITLYPWQDECINKWSPTQRGTLKVVTGAGKTLVALAIIQKLQNSLEPDLRVAIVVPTIVLMNQWYDEFLKHGNLPECAIGRLGGDYSGDFSKQTRVLICVLASAQRKLPEIVNSSGVGSRLMLVVDECHRSGAATMSHVFKTSRKYNLGLSATPERDDDDINEEDREKPYSETLLGKELGPIIYEFTLANAIELGIIPRFKVMHYGISMSPVERIQYDKLSRQINDLEKDLRNLQNSGKRGSVPLFRFARTMSTRGTGHVGELAAAYVRDTRRRKELLYKIESRAEAVEAILKQEFSNRENATAILFHESIDEVMKLFLRLQKAGFPVVAEHSDLPDAIREESLELFRRGVARVIVSAKSLIEGFNVPSADVGIIVASSSSARQRIQSLGRVLRKHHTSTGEEKNSCIYVLYASDTVDESIYGKENWGLITGIDANQYYQWSPDQPLLAQAGPPRSPLPADIEVDLTNIRAGQPYPGQYEGEEYSCDTSGNIKDNYGKYITNPGNIPSLIISLRGQAGAFKITPKMHYIIAGRGHGDEWELIYIGKLENNFETVSEGDNQKTQSFNLDEWISTAHPGNPYPFNDVPITDASVTYRQKHGGVLAKPIKDGEAYANVSPQRGDPIKAEDALKLISAIKLLQNQGLAIHKLEINQSKDVLFRANGALFFIIRLNSGLEFPSVI